MSTISIDSRRIRPNRVRPSDARIELRTPVRRDGQRIHALVAECPPLDRNSMYCNLLQATHFADTSVVAELDGALVGCITGYRLPDDPSVLFVWQVAVAERGRGLGLAKAMLHEIVDRHAGEIRHVHTTITPDNAASWALFSSFARELDAPTRDEVMFARDLHFGGAHDEEMVLRIGPIAVGATQGGRRRAAAGR